MNADFFSLPLTNPIAIFLLVLLIILGAPLLNRLRIPHIVGLILAGVALGPHGFNVLANDQSFELFGKVGILYIMFLAGLEIDLNTFKKNSAKGAVFGGFTFLIPMIFGTLAGVYLLHFKWITSVLLASMFASHTLIAYPIVSRMGVSKSRAASITIAGTIITITLSLLILTVIVALNKSQISGFYFLKLGISTIVFAFVVFFLFPKVARFFLSRFSDAIVQYIFVLALVFAASLLAQMAGLEGILGAFFAGLVLNRFIPSVSPLMNRVEFIGNAIFIPFFLISIGMLVDIRCFFGSFQAIWVAMVMILVATFSKWLAAFFTQKSCKLTSTERTLMFGLSNGKAAVSLAAVMIGYNIGLLNEQVLNGTVVMIFVTCAISSIVTEKSARKLATEEVRILKNRQTNFSERILVPIYNSLTMRQLLGIGNLIKQPSNRKALFGLNNESMMTSENDVGTKLMENACKTAASTDNELTPIFKNDVNVINSLLETMTENNISDLLLVANLKNKSNSFFNSTYESVASKSFENIIIYGEKQPINRVRRLLIAVPSKAELEVGFEMWFERMKNFSLQLGVKIVFYSDKTTKNALKKLCENNKNLHVSFHELLRWEDFLMITKEITDRDMMAVISARKQTLSYNPLLEKVPYYLTKYFAANSFFLIFPKQTISDEKTGELFNPLHV